MVGREKNEAQKKLQDTKHNEGLATSSVPTCAQGGKDTPPQSSASKADELTSPKKRGAKADLTRKLLLDAALKVIGEKGYSAATVDEIVEVAGVSKGVAYYHFKSKAAMAESILEEGLGILVDDFERIVAASPAATEALTGMIECFATRIFENKAFGRFFVSELWREGRVWSGAMRGYEHRLLHLIEGQLARGKEEGLIRDAIDPTFEAVALVGMVLTTTLYYLADEDEEGDSCTILSTFSPANPHLAKEVFIERICDFVRHANIRPELSL